MRLAEALILAKRSEEARSHLMALWDRAPGDGRVNLELARIAAAAHQDHEAARHYEMAIHGSWESGADVARRQARQDLISFYLGRGALSQAEAQLIALAPDLPRDPVVQTDLGRTFLRTGSLRRALAAFKAALVRDPLSAPAAAGAGEASFRLGDYASARRYLRAAALQAPNDPDVERTLAITDLVLMMDPYRPRLRAPDRARRLGLAWRTAMARLEACAASQQIVLQKNPQAPAQPGAPPVWQAYRQLAPLSSQLSADTLQRDPERLDRLMDSVLAAAAVTQDCGPREPADDALLLIGRHDADVP
jgi:tetratricopeptide (TPR) repeat protein